jgi:DNA alkylation damage repair protein AlkB
MSIKMVCLGRHWNAKTYKYESIRSDHDGLPVQELPDDLKELARSAAAEAGMTIEPDICLVNCYPEAGRLGLHQDKDERPETIESGIPVVSFSLGDSAKFMIGGTRRKDPVKTIILESGDAFVMGGASRLRYHGVSGILQGTAPKELGIQGRFNLTFRQY